MFARLVLLLRGLLLLAACGTNPVTGRQQLALVPDARMIEASAQAGPAPTGACRRRGERADGSRGAGWLRRSAEVVWLLATEEEGAQEVALSKSDLRAQVVVDLPAVRRCVEVAGSERGGCLPERELAIFPSPRAFDGPGGKVNPVN